MTTEQIPKTYDEAAQTLARWQGESGESDLQIFSFPDPEQKVVRLLHVSEMFADTDGVYAIKMGKSQEFPFKSSVALTMPKYWARIKAGELLLPEGWDATTARKVWPDEGA
jgi:hypothetical protein